jgi:hypothetical protein
MKGRKTLRLDKRIHARKWARHWNTSCAVDWYYSKPREIHQLAAQVSRRVCKTRKRKQPIFVPVEQGRVGVCKTRKRKATHFRRQGSPGYAILPLLPIFRNRREKHLRTDPHGRDLGFCRNEEAQ